MGALLHTTHPQLSAAGPATLGPPPPVGRIAGAWLRQRPAGLPRSRRVARGALRMQRLSAAARCRHQHLRPWESQGDFDELTLLHTPCIFFSPKICVCQMAEKCTHSHAYVNVAHMRAGRCAVGAGPAGARDLGPALDVNGVRHQRHAARRAARRQAAAAARAVLRQLRLPNNGP